MLLSSLGHVSSDSASRQDFLSELESHSKRSEHETKEEISDKANLDKKIEDLKQSYPQVTTKKVYRLGVIKVQLAPQSKREYERISSEISDKIKNIPGVINVWFAGGKNFNLLVDIGERVNKAN